MSLMLRQNNEQHKFNLNYLSHAQRCLEQNQPGQAASMIRAFVRAEQIRRMERARLSTKASPHESKEIALKLALEKLIVQRMMTRKAA